MYKLLWDFETHTDYQISARRPDLVNRRKKKEEKRTCRTVDFADLADLRVKLKESEKRGKYLNLSRELKKLWYTRMTVIPIVIDELGTITKELVKGLEELEIRARVKTIQTTELWRSARILKGELKTWKKPAVTQIPVEDHRQTLVWKTLKEVK